MENFEIKTQIIIGGATAYIDMILTLKEDILSSFE